MLAGVRMAIGAGAWATPRLAGRLFGLDVAGNPQAPYLARLFGARDLALAWGALGAEGSARRQWLLAGLACDLADALAGVGGGGGGHLPRAAPGVGGGGGGLGRPVGAAPPRGAPSPPGPPPGPG